MFGGVVICSFIFVYFAWSTYGIDRSHKSREPCTNQCLKQLLIGLNYLAAHFPEVYTRRKGVIACVRASEYRTKMQIARLIDLTEKKVDWRLISD